MNLKIKKTLLAFSLSGLLLLPAARAYAYNGGTAASYADQYALNGNSQYPSFSDDCTNFVSQALNHGGEQMVNYNYLPSNDGAWYMYYSSYNWLWSNSWSVAGDQWQYLHNSGHASQWYTWSGKSYATNHSGLYAGDVLYYSWDAATTGGRIDHVAIQVQDNYDNRNNYTSVVDEHTTNRYHVNWTLYDFNQKATTTQIYAVHVNS